MITRAAIIGNSGSGKSTLARVMARDGAVATLDLDTVYWEPGKIAVERPVPARIADVRKFCGSHDSWIIEGCYGDLIEAAFPWRPELLFLNPGREVCLRNCRNRPFETHKYGSGEEQDAMLGFLLDWVEDYYNRTGPMSFSGHLDLYERYDGPKRQITGLNEIWR